MEEKKRSQFDWRSIRRVFLRVVLSILAMLTFLLLFFYVSSLFLTTESVSVQTDVATPIRIVHLTDLHNAQFGKHNQKLVESVISQAPDLIFMSGDMLNSDDENTDIITSLISDLVSTAPVYYGYGNSEKTWEWRFGRSLRPILETAGAVVVDVEYVDLELHGSSLRIGGYMGYYPVPSMTTASKTQEALELDFIKDFEDTDRVKLLINHIPTGWIDWHYANSHQVDLVFSGHYHGGIIRIPFLNQGLYAPYVGWFPPFSKGAYAGTHATCVLSAGLGTNPSIPRINNPPEIVVVDLIPPPSEGLQSKPRD